MRPKTKKKPVISIKRTHLPCVFSIHLSKIGNKILHSLFGSHSLMLNRIRFLSHNLLNSAKSHKINCNNYKVNKIAGNNKRMSSIIANIGNRDERIMNGNENEIEFMETPDKSESDPKDYR